MATRIRYQLYKQLTNGWTVLAFDDVNRRIIEQRIDVGNVETALDLVKVHAGQNVTGIDKISLMVEGTG